MYLMQEDLARAHRSSRQHEAQQARRGRQVRRARRLSAKAEASVQRARLAVARVA